MPGSSMECLAFTKAIHVAELGMMSVNGGPDYWYE
jgi:hypothetical protein